MATIRHLNRAPIREAVVDLRVSVSDFESGQLDRFREAVTPDFPVCEKQRNYDTLIDLTQSGSTYASRDPDEGYICRSDERHAAVIFSAKGFSFSRLHPYTDWDTVISDARRYWQMYLQHIAVERITRIAVRFINSFTIPRHRPLDRYLTATPALPETFTTAELNSSVVRMVLNDERAGIASRVTQVLEPSDTGMSVILNTDSFAVDESPVNDEVWARFAELRDMKNRIFFGSLTELALEEFE